MVGKRLKRTLRPHLDVSHFSKDETSGGCQDQGRAADWEGNTAAVRKWSVRLFDEWGGWKGEETIPAWFVDGEEPMKRLKDQRQSPRLSLLSLRSRHSDIPGQGNRLLRVYG